VRRGNPPASEAEKFIQVAVSGNWVVAVTNEGRAFILNEVNQVWNPLPPVPERNVQ
jgi:hypothetical protein